MAVEMCHAPAFGPYLIEWDSERQTLTITGDENTRARIHSSIHNDIPVVITINQYAATED